MRFHQDDRAIRYCDVFDVMREGDINISVIHPGALSAWHRHQNQDDYLLVIKGALKVGICREDYPEATQNIEWYYLSERSAQAGPLHIPAGIWHGTYNFTNEPVILIYFITQKYDPNDEERGLVAPIRWERKPR